MAMLRQRYGRWDTSQVQDNRLLDQIAPLVASNPTGLIKNMRTRSEHGGANVKISKKLGEAGRLNPEAVVDSSAARMESEANAVVVVVGIDFSGESVGALRWALATKLVRGEMRVVLLHAIKAFEYRWEHGKREKVFRMPQPPLVSSMFRPPTKRALNWQETKAEVEAVMEPLIRMCNGYETPCQVVTVECPERIQRRKAILDGAADLKASFLVLGSGTGRVARSFFQLQLSLPAFCSKYPPPNCTVLMVHNNEMVLTKNSNFAPITNIGSPTDVVRGKFSAPGGQAEPRPAASRENSLGGGQTPTGGPASAFASKGLLDLLDDKTKPGQYNTPSQSSNTSQEAEGARRYSFSQAPSEASPQRRYSLSQGPEANRRLSLSRGSSGGSEINEWGKKGGMALQKPGGFDTKSEGSVDSSDEEDPAESEVEMLRAMLARAELVAKIAQIDAEEAAVREKAAEARREAMEAMIERERQRREEAESMARNLQMEVALKLERELEMSRVFTGRELEEATHYFDASNLMGDGAFGKIYHGQLNSRDVSIRVLMVPGLEDAEQFQIEAQGLRWIRHPNIVPLVGCCPEKAALVYDFMPNGSLADRLKCKSGPNVLTWRQRMQIAVEVATALLFLHTAPKPLVYSILRPSKILLDTEHFARIADVGLTSFVQSAGGIVRSEAGFPYLDPEYQSTGVLEPKSDLYALGVVLLQLLINRPPFGLRGVVEDAISDGFLMGLIDTAMPTRDVPVESVREVALLALQCTEMRRRDRPDLKMDVLPILQRAMNSEVGASTHVKEVTSASLAFPSPLPSPSGSLKVTSSMNESSLAKYCMPSHYQGPGLSAVG